MGHDEMLQVLKEKMRLEGQLESLSSEANQVIVTALHILGRIGYSDIHHLQSETYIIYYCHKILKPSYFVMLKFIYTRTHK